MLGSFKKDGGVLNIDITVLSNILSTNWGICGVGLGRAVGYGPSS